MRLVCVYYHALLLGAVALPYRGQEPLDPVDYSIISNFLPGKKTTQKLRTLAQNSRVSPQVIGEHLNSTKTSNNRKMRLNINSTPNALTFQKSFPFEKTEENKV